jgi:hypothetical protein
MCDIRKTYRILVGNLKKRDHLEYLGVDGEKTKMYLKNSA